MILFANIEIKEVNNVSVLEKNLRRILTIEEVIWAKDGWL